MSFEQPTCTSVVALVLAAGRGRRFGADKRQARLPGGRQLLSATLASLTAVFADVVLVLRANDTFNTLALPRRVKLVHAERADEGMGASLATGVMALKLRELPDHHVALAVLLGDMPWIAAATLKQLAQQARPDRIVRPVHQGRFGHPVLFGREFWPLLTELSGDEGARAVLKRYGERIIDVPVEDGGIHRDVDHPDDLGE